MESTRETGPPTPQNSGDLWAILLAAGDGSRVYGLASDAWGAIAPKQFCALNGRESMLRWSVQRALGMVPKNRVVPVVAAKHRRWWARDLADLPPANIVIQPRNRGTAAGILLPLLRVLQQDRHASVLILPSDHHVDNEPLLRRSISRAVDSIETGSCRIELLGMVPQGIDGGYGWIVPASTAELTQVEAFVEKPDGDEARSLMRRGALLNSFIIAARAEALLQLYVRELPDLVGEFVSWKNEAGGRRSALAALYDGLPSQDFSREILERSPASLSVVRVPGCGWTDLGAPARLRDYLELHRPELCARNQRRAAEPWMETTMAASDREMVACEPNDSPPKTTVARVRRVAKAAFLEAKRRNLPRWTP